MEPIAEPKLEHALLDAARVRGRIFLLDTLANLHVLNEKGEIERKKALLKNPPAAPLPRWGACLSDRGECLMQSAAGEVRSFSFLEATGQKRFTLSPHPPKLSAHSADGGLIATLDSSGFLTIGSALAGGFYSLCPQTMRRGCALFFSPDARWLFAGDTDGEALIYDLLLHRVALRFTLPKTVEGGLFLEGGRLLLSGADRDLFFVSWHAGGVLQGHLPLPKVRPGALIGGDSYAFAGTESGAIAAINLQTRQLARLWPLTDQPINMIRKRGDQIVAGGTRGAVFVFDQSLHLGALKEAIAAEDYAAARKLADQNGFLLLENELVEFFDTGWEEKVFPRILTHLEQGQHALARETAEPFLDDPAKERRFAQALSLAMEMRDLREAVKGRHYDHADELIALHPLLKECGAGQLYCQGWMSAYDDALEFLSRGDRAGAKKALEYFLPVKAKVETIGHLIHFAPLFIKARELLRHDQIHAFYELAQQQPILKGMPHYETLTQKGEEIRAQMLTHAARHDYRNELACAKNLARFAPYALEARNETERIRAEALFHNAIRKDRYADAFELAASHLYLADESAFYTLFAPYKHRFEHALEAAKRGDGEGVMTLMAEPAKSPLLKDGVALLFRIAHNEQIKNVTLGAAVDWARTFEHYTRLFGCDPLIAKTAREFEEEEALTPFAGRTHLRGYEKSGFEPTVLHFKPLDKLRTGNGFAVLLRIGAGVLIILILFLALALLTDLAEKPMEEYKEEVKRESPYKLFENLSKRQERLE